MAATPTDADIAAAAKDLRRAELDNSPNVSGFRLALNELIDSSDSFHVWPFVRRPLKPSKD